MTRTAPVHRQTAAAAVAATLLVTLLLGAPGASGATGSQARAVGAASSTIMLIEDEAQWSYWRSRQAPDPQWREIDFEDDWPTGTAPFGYGSRVTAAAVATLLPDTVRPSVISTYFRREFQLSDQPPSELIFRTWADDSVVVYLNGEEIGRERMDARVDPIPHNSYFANAAVNSARAQQSPLMFALPASLLREGTNVLAVQVTANWRQSPDITFGGRLTGTTLTTAPIVAPEPPAPVDGPLPEADVIPEGANWEYHHAATAPPVQWRYSPTMSWPTGPAPLGYGSSGLATTLPAISPRPLSSYFRTTFTVDSTNSGLLREGARFVTRADDGIVVLVNGHEVGRERIDATGAALHGWTWANAAISTSNAQRSPVVFEVPGRYLREGTNVVAVQVVANYRATRDISFEGRLEPGGGGAAPAIGTYDPSLRLAWSEEFDGDSLDTTNWVAYNNSTYGDGNRQLECNTSRPENLRVEGGELVLTARREAVPYRCGHHDSRFPGGREFTSAHIWSVDRVEFMYGRLEMRARLPVAQGASQGLWPAFWLRPVDGGLGEIDIVEALGSGPGQEWSAGIVHQTVHRDYTGTPSSGFNYQLPDAADMSQDYHVYALEWEPDELRWYVDGVLTRTVTADDVAWFHEAFHEREFRIRVNLAVGGSWPGSPTGDTSFPAEMRVDYIRLYQ